MPERHSFNVNAELYQNQYGEMAVKLPGEKVYCEVGEEEGANFLSQMKKALLDNQLPPRWGEMPAHELLYAPGWECIVRFGFLDGAEDKPALELEVDKNQIGEKARAYLGTALL